MKRSWLSPRMCAASLGALAIAGITAQLAWSEVAPEPPENPLDQLGSLKGVAPPLPDLTGIVKDREMAIVLGKALFWDMNAGSDGQACASCHFHAGADTRVKNQLSPGLLHQGDLDNNGTPGDQSFGGLTAGTEGLRKSGLVAAPNVKMKPDDFPFHQLADPDDRDSAILYTTNDVMSSMGTFDGTFTNVVPGSPGVKPDADSDICERPAGDVFHTRSGYPVRKVEPRQTPTTINAVFNFRNFWDGRANNIFNGKGVFGRREIQNDPTARIVVYDMLGGASLQSMELENASLASQAVGPPLSDFEMSCAQRNFADIGRKLINATPLASQKIHPHDSVLGRYRGVKGLLFPYRVLIQRAFHSKYWKDNGKYTITPAGVLQPDPNGYTQMELNFSMFWGIAIMLYESTLVSDDAPFDRFMDGDNYALSAKEKRGLEVFLDKGKCVNCHAGPEFTKAAIHLQAENQEEGLVERMLMGEGQVAHYDNGFYNIGARPTEEDIGVGGVDPWGIPLSFTRQWFDMLAGNNVPDPFQVDPCTFEELAGQDPNGPEPNGFDDNGECDSAEQREILEANLANERDAVDGAFKTPTLRNVGLTPPYMHNGGQATLHQVVEFYDRGGDLRSLNPGDTSGFNGNDSNLDPDITNLGLTEQEQDDLVAFLLSLTDQRVACESAPFDHPELRVSNGHRNADRDNDGRADDQMLTIPPIGRNGRSFEGLNCLKNSGDLFNQASTY